MNTPQSAQRASGRPPGLIWSHWAPKPAERLPDAERHVLGSPHHETCWADHPVHIGRSSVNFHCLQPAARTPDIGLCRGHLTEIFGITPETRP